MKKIYHYLKKKFSNQFESWSNKGNQHSHIYRVLNGILEFRKTGITPVDAYKSMRYLHVLTEGKSTELFGQFVMEEKVENLNPLNGVLGFENLNEFNVAIKQIREDGYFVFPKKLSSQVIDKITRFAMTEECEWSLGVKNTQTSEVIINEIKENRDKILSARCDFSQEKIFQNQDLIDLIFDESILAFSQEYLNCKPKLDLTAMWWSFPFDGDLKSEAAQLYHFDLDRLKFIKFFFYLTDVNSQTGPHCYVKGSHKNWIKGIKKGGRYEDKQILNSNSKTDIVEICGKKGTIIAVDTKGIHKGKSLEKDQRLIFQIEFANSLFGQNYQKLKLTENLLLKQKNQSCYLEYFN